MAQHWKIKLVDKIEDFDLGHCYGTCERHRSLIEIAKTVRDEKCTENQMTLTFLHELTHAILYHLGEKELNDNERFVESFSGLLHQALTTAK